MIKKSGDKFVLYTKDGTRILGTHYTRSEAVAQEIKIKLSEKKKSK